MYVRKSDDVGEIMDCLRDCVLYISAKQTNRRPQYVYLERWALDALEAHMLGSNVQVTAIPSSDERRTLGLKNSHVLLKEWNPEDDTQGSRSTSL